MTRRTGNTGDGISKCAARRAILNHGDAIVIGPGSLHHRLPAGRSLWAQRPAYLGHGDESGKLTGDPPGAVVLQAPYSGGCRAGMFPRGAPHHLRAHAARRWAGDQAGEMPRRDCRALHLLADDARSGGRRGGRVARGELRLFPLHHRPVPARHGEYAPGAEHRAASTSTGVLLLDCGAGAIRNSLFAENNANYLADTRLRARRGAVITMSSVGRPAPGADAPPSLISPNGLPPPGRSAIASMCCRASARRRTYDLHIAAGGHAGVAGLPGMTCRRPAGPRWRWIATGTLPPRQRHGLRRRLRLSRPGARAGWKSCRWR